MKSKTIYGIVGAGLLFLGSGSFVGGFLHVEDSTISSSVIRHQLIESELNSSIHIPLRELKSRSPDITAYVDGLTAERDKIESLPGFAQEMRRYEEENTKKRVIKNLFFGVGLSSILFSFRFLYLSNKYKSSREVACLSADYNNL